MSVALALAGLFPAWLWPVPAGAQTCANAIVCENQKPGNPSTQWDLPNPDAGDPSIQGFATDISYNRGDTISFKISTPATRYHLDIYRMGYYQGNGARLITTIRPTAALPQNQPACLADGPLGLVDCGNWGVSATWTIPATQISGIYFAKVIREDTGGASHIVFIIRDDASTSDVLLQASDTTWQAYNAYGGSSLYHGTGSSADGRAYKVSYNRPFSTRGQLAGDGPTNWVFYAEYPMVRWLESNGYNVTYFTDTDSDRRGALIKQHKVFLSVGHDEYWSGNQRANVEAARAAGVNLAFFSGNEMFWKTRWENSIDGSGTAFRTLVTYKETKVGGVLDPADPPSWTGTWRDPSVSPPADGGRPENALTGTIFMVNRGSAAITVPSDLGKLRFWRNTAAANLAAGQTLTLGDQTLGYEWDADLDNGARPPGTFRLSSTTVSVPELLVDNGNTFVPGTATHNLTLYRASSGALVFGAGTVQWVWGLDVDHDISPDTGPTAPDRNMQQATANLLADMGVQPATPQGMLTATASTDVTPPRSTITAPAGGATLQQSNAVTITGSASDTGGVVAGVEVSIDGGSSWHPATGTTSWTYSWTPSTPGSVTIRSRAVDDSGNVETPSAGVTVTVAPRGCPCSIWSGPAAPAVAASGDATAVEVGVKFRTEVDGTISGVRFYKGSGNTGTHVGNLWSSTGQLLASATFTNETASGWQQVSFATPVQIHGNATYVASYHTNTGNYAADAGAFATAGVDNYPLHALKSGVDGPNGVFRYAASSVFPTQSFNETDYWVDVVFATASPDTIPPVITSQTPQTNATSVPVTGSLTATFNEPVQASTISFTLRGPSGATAPATVSYDAPSRTVTLQPSPALAQATTYTASLSGAADLAGNVMAPVTWSLTTEPATSIWSGPIAPNTPAAADTQPVEVGVKFKSDTAGSISGVRFYKGSGNTGTHVGNLWSSTGQLLASATFTDETASGWQQVLFATPVGIAANTTYVASYHTNTGNYAADAGFFGTAGVDHAPLHALSNAAAAGNGVFAYGAASAFPSQTFNATNYWVDVVFTTVAVDNARPTVTAQSPAAGAIVSPSTSLTATFSEPVQATTISFVLKDQASAAVPATMTYNSASLTATLQPNVVLAQGATYTATVSGAADTSGNVMAPASWSFSVPSCPCSIWSSSATPGNPAANDPTAVEVGVKFRADIGGFINGIRFYKGSTNTGPHVGSLWTSTGQLLASATFTNETATGWQQVLFPSPVQITANTTYVASYHTNSGNYAADGNLFAKGVDSGALHALANGVDGPNGVFIYSATSAFPTQTFNATNYWVDVVFNSTFTDTAAPTVTAQTPAPNATKVSPNTALTVTFSKPVTANTISFVLKDQANAAVPATMTYNSTTLTATLQPNAALALGVTYTATVSGATDSSGNVMAPVSWSFSTLACPCSIWSTTATPAMPATSDPSAIEVGVKFRSDMAGSIRAIRFYKGTTNTGTHVVSLWTSTGTLLATATATNETTSGWQQVNFATPVQITANTTYVASYHTTSGNYAADSSFFANAGVDNAPLHALANGADGPNGVFIYSATSAFPTQTFNATNYWIDLVFGGP